MKKPKIYQLILSSAFLKDHPRTGKPTYFAEKILKALYPEVTFYPAQCDDCERMFFSNNCPDTDDDPLCPFCGSNHLSDIDMSLRKEYYLDKFDPKLHTIRADYEEWKRKIDEVNRGEAVLRVICWSGAPYNSKQLLIATLNKDSGCGLQKIYFDLESTSEIDEWLMFSDYETLAKNDGLSLDDFKAWFKSYDLSKPMAIIHFTKFRY
jgi:hypothetical protein